MIRFVYSYRVTNYNHDGSIILNFDVINQKENNLSEYQNIKTTLKTDKKNIDSVEKIIPGKKYIFTLQDKLETGYKVTVVSNEKKSEKSVVSLVPANNELCGIFISFELSKSSNVQKLFKKDAQYFIGITEVDI